jgi:hypothetical protein
MSPGFVSGITGGFLDIAVMDAELADGLGWAMAERVNVDAPATSMIAPPIASTLRSLFRKLNKCIISIGSSKLAQVEGI